MTLFYITACKTVVNGIKLKFINMRFNIVLLLIIVGCVKCFSQLYGNGRTMYIPYNEVATHIYSDTASVCITEDGKFLHIDRGYDKATYKFHTTKWFRKGRIRKYPNAIDYFVSDDYIYIDYWLMTNRRQVIVYRERYLLIKSKSE